MIKKELVIGHTEALFSTHLVPLERFQRDNSNHTLKDLQA
jgi:hypothetical protein